MASIKYLWNNRAKFSIGSTPYFKAWAKRVLLLKVLYQRNARRKRLVRSGACIHECAEIGNVSAGGNKRNLSIGAFSFIGEIELALHDKITIGKYVCINDGAHLLTASHNVSDPQWRHVKAPIIIDDYVWIATGAIILPGVHIKKGAVIGAGAVVSKNVEIGAIVVGNPAITINKTRSEKLDYNPCEFLAANRAWLVG